MSHAYFISGIDTDAGKSYVTGYLAAKLIEKGVSFVKNSYTPATGIFRKI